MNQHFGQKTHQRLIVHQLNHGHMEKLFIGLLTIYSFCFYMLKIFSYRELLNTSIVHGITGNIEFNEEGDRIESLYEIINIQQGQLQVVGTYQTNTVSLRCFF